MTTDDKAFARIRAILVLQGAGIVGDTLSGVRYLDFHGGDHRISVSGQTFLVDLVLGKWRAA
jgi:hypothetical protein